MEGVGRAEGDKLGAELARAREEERATDLAVSMASATADADVGGGEVKEVKLLESEEEWVSSLELVEHAGRLDISIGEQGSMAGRVKVGMFRQEYVETSTESGEDTRALGEGIGRDMLE